SAADPVRPGPLRRQHHAGGGPVAVPDPGHGGQRTGVHRVLHPTHPMTRGGRMIPGTMTKRTLAVVVSALALAGAACSKGASPGGTSPPRPLARPSSTAHLSLVSPTNGEVIHGSSVNLQITLTGARIVP